MYNPPKIWIEIANVTAREVTLTIHLTHHTSSSLDDPPADPDTVSMSVTAKEPQATLAVKMPHKAMENTELEVTDEEGLVAKRDFSLAR